jgi:glycosyltransferase involved in cell wall biosynthesis
MLRFIILVTGYNCHQRVSNCVDSLNKQTYKNFEAIFISDGSTDLTAQKLRNIPYHIKIHNKNMGAAFRRWEALQEYGSSKDVILLLGMDDQLLPDALEIIKKEYDNGKWMTYGNYITQHGYTLPDGFLYFTDDVHRKRSYRKEKYRSTAPNTFYKFLFDQIPICDFQVNGRWIDSTTESEVMFSCLEMCGKERIGVIEKPIYFYNERLRNGTLRRLGRDYKYRLYNEIIKRKPKELWTSGMPQ